MSSKRMILSARGKKILDDFVGYLSLTRPQVLKLAFAKGYTNVNYATIPTDSMEKGWEIPDVFSEDDLLLFKHLIINKLERELDSSEMVQELLRCLEIGLYIFDQLYNERNSLDDLKMLIIR
ncbi:hypothetical protein [Cohnella sp. GCM10027633]|uniref:hypothetical protein n=1 Tax=unclassified Cohnella TaxID=2636738 RepID=UPI003635648B